MYMQSRVLLGMRGRIQPQKFGPSAAVLGPTDRPSGGRLYIYTQRTLRLVGRGRLFERDGAGISLAPRLQRQLGRSGPSGHEGSREGQKTFSFLIRGRGAHFGPDARDRARLLRNARVLGRSSCLPCERRASGQRAEIVAGRCGALVQSGGRVRCGRNARMRGARRPHAPSQH